jgi:aerobic-type carbon monoxide dehydrogenase small subunit (CoxS/CutS family)
MQCGKRGSGLQIELTINDKTYQPEVDAGETLLELLRRLGFKSVKFACGTGNCGACTVLLDGRPVMSCLMLAAQADGRSVTTVEGLSTDGGLHPLQQAFMELGAPQCGFCTPGMLMAAVGLLSENPDPTREEVREAISGNICRCSGYVKVVDAVIAAAKLMREGADKGNG